MEACAVRARAAAQALARLSAAQRDHALAAVGRGLTADRQAIEAASALDLSDAAAAVAAGAMSRALLDRLDMGPAKLDALLDGLDGLRRLPDPLGQLGLCCRLADGLQLSRVSCPIGVLLVIFESRPEAVVQIAGLAVKSGNALLLKGGREAGRTSEALVASIASALRAAGLPDFAVQAVGTRGDVAELLKLDSLIDLVIPRGSNALVRSVKQMTSIPVLGHADGLCAVYVDRAADLTKATAICVDSKTQYCAACNAMETLLVHEAIVSDFLPLLAVALRPFDGVCFRASADCLAHLPPLVSQLAVEEDFKTEFLSLHMAVRQVHSVQCAIDHINWHGSHHTDAIVTEDAGCAEEFLRGVDSAGVFHNASTRFADGYRFGFGAEVGISTSRIHARGPVGLDGLVTYKYRLCGQGHTVADFSGPSPKRRYVHEPVLGVSRIEDVGCAGGALPAHGVAEGEDKEEGCDQSKND